MSEESLYEESKPKKRRGLSTFFSGLARRLRRGKRVPVNDAQDTVVDIPSEVETGIEVTQESDEVSLQVNLSWSEDDIEEIIETDVIASKARFEVYRDAGDKHRWRLIHDNGNIIADGSEGYASKQKAKQGLESVRSNAPGAYVVDVSKDEDTPKEGGSDATFEVFKDKAEEWRWRLVHDNGNILADGGQGYASKQKAKQGLTSVQINVPGAPIEEPE